MAEASADSGKGGPRARERRMSGGSERLPQRKRQAVPRVRLFSLLNALCLEALEAGGEHTGRSGGFRFHLLGSEDLIHSEFFSSQSRAWLGEPRGAGGNSGESLKNGGRWTGVNRKRPEAVRGGLPKHRSELGARDHQDALPRESRRRWRPFSSKLELRSPTSR